VTSDVSARIEQEYTLLALKTAVVLGIIAARHTDMIDPGPQTKDEESMSIRRIPHTNKRALRQAFDDLEGRRLMSTFHTVASQPSAPAIVDTSHHKHANPQGHLTQNQHAGHYVHRTKLAEVQHTANPSKATDPNTPVTTASSNVCGTSSAVSPTFGMYQAADWPAALAT
jgi:hypothetical protein